MCKIMSCDLGRWRQVLRASTVVLLLPLVGCTTVMPPPIATGARLESLRAANVAPAAVGVFKLAPGLPLLMDTELRGGLRGGNIVAPGGSYSQHLKETLKAELHSAGLFDPQSKYVVEALLTDNKVDAAISTGSARLAARFRVVSEGQVLFNKEMAAEDSWESSFAGAVAIPRAIEHYEAMYSLLVGRLLGDSDFHRALAR